VHQEKGEGAREKGGSYWAILQHWEVREKSQDGGIEEKEPWQGRELSEKGNNALRGLRRKI